jgi:hypothetical protein
MVLQTAFFLPMLVLDLGVLYRHSHEISVREAAIKNGAWVAFFFESGIGLYFSKVAGRLPPWSGPQPLTGNLFATIRSTIRPANSGRVVSPSSAFDVSVELG